MIRILAPALFLSLFAVPVHAAPASPFEVGARSGPFVVTNRSLGDLLKDGYEIRGNLGNALVLQKAASVFSCMIPPDPEHLSYQPYFVCSELREEPRDAASAKSDGKAIAPGH